MVGWSYPQTGIVATVEHEKPHNGVAYEHFLPSGPFAILPMTGNRASLVWTEDQRKAPALLALDEAGFNEELSRRFGDHLGKDRNPPGRAGLIPCPSIWRAISCGRALRWQVTAPMASIPSRGRG